jgi:hypothetical protein
MLAERKPIYEAAAQCIIDTSNFNRTEALETLLARAERHLDGSSIRPCRHRAIKNPHDGGRKIEAELA